MALRSVLFLVYLNVSLLMLPRCTGTTTSREIILAPEVAGIRAEDSPLNSFGGALTSMEGGLLTITAGVDIDIRLFGKNFMNKTEISFTRKTALPDNSCDDLRETNVFRAEPSRTSSESALFRINLPMESNSNSPYYICVKEVTERVSSSSEGVRAVTDDIRWIHQGSHIWLSFNLKPAEIKQTVMPIPIQVFCLLLLLCLSGTFSGLNLGLMALDKTELAIVENCGSAREKKYAKKIRPVRAKGNFLLCTLLLGNVLVNSTLTILLDDLSSGLIAIIGSTLAIVIFGEIVPQAICCRHGLAVGAYTIYLTKLFMIITGILSWPISKILDYVLGDEMGTVYNRAKLIELLKVTQEHHDIENEEVRIISGALHLTTRTVQEVMTKLEDAFMLQYSARLDFETMSLIMKQGYTRIPVYEGERKNIVAVLNIKDLAFVDPDDNTPLATVCKFYKHPVAKIFSDTTLAQMLDDFKKGNYHVAFVQEVVEVEDKDPEYVILGLVTLEDIIEEIIQEEILDETDVVTDNREKKPRAQQVRQDFLSFVNLQEGGSANQPQISPQLQLATFQFLSTSVEPFKGELISETVLKRLIRQNIFHSMKIKDCDEDQLTIFKAGKPVDYFFMVLEGRVQVLVGKEKLLFESGPFSYYGIQALSDVTGTKGGFIPDYSVIVATDMQYILVKRSQYWAARRATLMEQQHRIESSEDFFSKEWAKAEKISHTDSLKEVFEDSPRNSKVSFNLSTPEHSNESPRDVIHPRTMSDSSSNKMSPETATLLANNVEGT